MPLPALAGIASAIGSAAATAGSGTGLSAELLALTGSLNTFKQAATSTATPLGALAKGVAALNKPVLDAVRSLSEFQESVNAVGNAVARFVQLANPGVAKQWQWATEDWTASIGQGLMPILQAATKVTRAFADVTFALAGPVQRLGRAFDPLANLVPKLTDALTPVVRALGSFVDTMAEIVNPLAEITALHLSDLVSQLASSFRTLYETMKPGIDLLAATTINSAKFIAVLSSNPLGQFATGAVGGRGAGGDSITGGSIGATARAAQLGSVESFQSKALSAAFGASGATPEARTAENTKSIYDLLLKLPDELRKIATDLGKEIAGAFSPGPETAARIDEITTRGRDLGARIEDEVNQFRGRLGALPSILFGSGE